MQYVTHVELNRVFTVTREFVPTCRFNRSLVITLQRPASGAHLGRGTMPRMLKQETVVLLHT